MQQGIIKKKNKADITQIGRVTVCGTVSSLFKSGYPPKPRFIAAGSGYSLSRRATVCGTVSSLFKSGYPPRYLGL